MSKSTCTHIEGREIYKYRTHFHRNHDLKWFLIYEHAHNEEKMYHIEGVVVNRRGRGQHGGARVFLILPLNGFVLWNVCRRNKQTVKMQRQRRQRSFIEHLTQYSVWTFTHLNTQSCSVCEIKMLRCAYLLPVFCLSLETFPHVMCCQSYETIKRSHLLLFGESLCHE